MKKFLKFYKNVLVSESVPSLLGRILKHYLRYLFYYKQYYLVKHQIFEVNESDYLPNLDSYEAKIIQSNDEAEKLHNLGYNFRSFWLLARKRLAKGGVAVCVFVEKNLVNIGWIALSGESKCTIDRLPYDVDFKSEACVAGSRTHQKYRRKGLMRYNEYHKYKFLWDNGIEIAKCHIEIQNINSQKALVVFHPEIYAQARYLVLLGWKSWKETPFNKPLPLSDVIS